MPQAYNVIPYIAADKWFGSAGNSFAPQTVSCESSGAPNRFKISDEYCTIGLLSCGEGTRGYRGARATAGDYDRLLMTCMAWVDAQQA